MNKFVFFAAAAVLIAGCSHEHHKADAPSAPAQPAAGKSAPAAPAKSDPKASAAAGGKIECANKNDNRVIEPRTKDKGCELAYTKGGKESVVASAQHGTEYCQKAAEKLRDKLKASGYTCK